MKYFITLLVFGISFTADAHGKNIPSPFWFSISERILTETQHLMNLDSKEPVSKAAVKVKPSQKPKSHLKCDEKKILVVPTNFFTISSSGIWIIND